MKRPAIRTARTVIPLRAALKENVEHFWEIVQGEPEWFEIRRGLPTASVMKTVMARGQDGGESKTRQRLLYRLAAEIINEEPVATYENDYMRRGRTMEAAALDDYAFTRAVEIKRVGFVRRTIADPLFGELVIGASPDGLIGDDGAVQTKTMEPDLICELVDSGRVPSEHRAQCQTELWVTGRQWCDLKIFFTGSKLSPVFRFTRDDHYIATELKPAAERFTFELRDLVKRLKMKGGLK